MRSTLFYLFFVLAGGFVCFARFFGKPHVPHLDVLTEYEVDPNLSDTLFTQSDSVYNPLTLVFEDENGVLHYDNVPDSNKYEVQSTCRIKDHWSPTIMFCDAAVDGKDLTILISEGTPAESKSVEILITDKRYVMRFNYDTPVPVERNFETTGSKLVLKKEPVLKRGEKIYGYLELQSLAWEEGTESKIEVSGYFKCTIP